MLRRSNCCPAAVLLDSKAVSKLGRSSSLWAWSHDTNHLDFSFFFCIIRRRYVWPDVFIDIVVRQTERFSFSDGLVDPYNVIRHDLSLVWPLDINICHALNLLSTLRAVRIKSHTLVPLLL